MSIVDLHTHTTASDGQYTPTQLVELAKTRGIQALAVTDHDNFDGVAEAQTAGERLGLRVIPGVEVGAREYRSLHILGYQFSPQASELLRLCQNLKDLRSRRNEEIVQFLEEQGVPVPLEEARELAGSEVVGRPHFAQAMVRRGYVSNNREAFDRYLDSPAYRKHFTSQKPPARVCIEAIKAAGGKASFAHPYQVGLEDEALEELVRQLTGWGLDAIECRYPKHTPAQEQFYRRLAEKYGLHITGGSDFHGEKVKPDVELARLEMDIDWLG